MISEKILLKIGCHTQKFQCTKAVNRIMCSMPVISLGQACVYDMA